ncbi:transposable element Tcb1 transposase [Trichonephila clavipes]|nr:transposable element Tcb1 transposase [Trichonephila clavipes]
MAALVSEYTLEFFTLLNARSKKELIEREWCMKEVLIVSSYECPECNEQMGLNERKSVVLDGFEWRCRKKGVNTHVCRSIRKRIRGFPINYHTKKNMQITRNDQMARIVRHNDGSVRERYIRNGDKEVKLFTSALKTFQCSKGIIIAQKKHLDDFLRGRIIKRLECGRTQLEVSKELGIAQSVISRLWQQFQDERRCYSTGRPRVTTPNEDRYLAVTAKRNRRSTATDLSCLLSSATSTTISRQIVYRRLGHIGLYARRPVRCVPLTATLCCLLLTWSREHALWAPQQWSCVMFSDESRLSSLSDSRWTLIWRTTGTRYQQENTIERHRYGGA